MCRSVIELIQRVRGLVGVARLLCASRFVSLFEGEQVIDRFVDEDVCLCVCVSVCLW